MAFSVRYHINNVYLNGPRLYGTTLLYQLGRAYCDSGARVAEHMHRGFFEWTIVTEGRGVIITNGERTEVRGGDIYLSFPEESHAIESDIKEPLSYDFLSMQTTDPELCGEMEKLRKKFADPRRRVVKSEKISAATSSAISELNDERRPFGGRLLITLFEQIFAYTIRKFNKTADSYAESVSAEDKLCYQLMHYVDTHIYTMKRLSEVCEITGYNYNYLSNLFKRKTSKTLMEYYTKRRLEVANMLLEEGKSSISSIAELLGYSSLYSFSRAYKTHFGFSPSEYSARASK